MFDTHVAIYIPLGTCVQMIVLFILTRFNDLIYYDDLFFTSPREWYFDTSTLVSFYPCAFVAAFVTLIVNVALSVGVDELSLTGERYKPYKGVRSMTKAGDFQIRT